MEKEEILELLEQHQAGDEAMAAFPDECANCGAEAAPFFVPNNYHELPEHKRDPGMCTECGKHFGTGNMPQ